MWTCTSTVQGFVLFAELGKAVKPTSTGRKLALTGLAQFGLAQFGLAQFGLAQFGLAQFGLAQFGYVPARSDHCGNRYSGDQ